MRGALLLLMSLALVCGCSSRKPLPEDLVNSGASLKGTLPYPVMDWKVLGSSVDRNAGTISTLFGNDVAVAAARNAPGSWPQGSVLGLVTWHAKEDAHWFGGRIPGVPSTVEFVELSGESTRLRRFSGAPLVEQPCADASRAQAIVSMRPVRLP